MCVTFKTTGIEDPNKSDNDDIPMELVVNYLGDEEELEPDLSYDFLVWGQNEHEDINGPNIETSGETFCK